MSIVEILIFTSLYFVIGGTIIFLTLVVIPAAVKGIRAMWINRNVSNEAMEEQYNITFQAVKDQYGSKETSIENLYLKEDNK